MKKRMLQTACLGLAAALALCGCGQSPAPEAALAADPAAFMAASGFDARETPQELYQKALEEGGSLVVYTSSTRTMDTKDSFEAQYPGLVVEVRDIRTSQQVGAILEERAEGRPSCDVAIGASNNTRLLEELLPSGLVCKYVPWDMADKMLYPDKENHLPYALEAEILCYNGAAWDEAPFTNLWELCEERFYGKVYCPTPLIASSSTALMLALMHMDEPMRGAYRQLYGKELDLPAGVPAGREYMRRLIANGLVLTNSSDEVAEAVGGPGQAGEAVGFIVSSKLRLNAVGYNLAPQYDLQPFTGLLSSNSVMIATGTPRVNTAKLFVRWLLGEADGTGAGYAPFLQPGAWPARSDVESVGTPPLTGLDFWESDDETLVENQQAFEDFWVALYEEARPAA